jgi:uncharacterized membrane protein YeaQ/YmgE (transglycosylase-associated protein family)
MRLGLEDVGHARTGRARFAQDQLAFAPGIRRGRRFVQKLHHARLHRPQSSPVACPRCRPGRGNSKKSFHRMAWDHAEAEVEGGIAAVVGIVGAFIGGWLMPQLGIHLGSGILAAIINATIGGLVLLLIIRLVRSGGSWGGGWGGWGRRCACSPSQTWSDVGTVPLGNTRRRRS